MCCCSRRACWDFPSAGGSRSCAAERDGLFWLQSMEYSTLAFLLVDPFTVDSDYSFDVQPSQIADLGPADPADVGLLSVVTLPANRDEQPTVNLQGPLIINFKTRQAKQVVSGDDQYGVRCPVDLASARGLRRARRLASPSNASR